MREKIEAILYTLLATQSQEEDVNKAMEEILAHLTDKIIMAFIFGLITGVILNVIF